MVQGSAESQGHDTDSGTYLTFYGANDQVMLQNS